MKENNELIAEFMGYENVGTLNNPMYDYYDNFFQDGSYEVKDLCYHESWDWLMPVVDRRCYEYGELDNDYREGISSLL